MHYSFFYMKFQNKNNYHFLENKKYPLYILLYKPENFLSESIINLLPLPQNDSQIYSVGRLDYDTAGALLLTNDKQLSNALSHPKYFIPKIYEIKIKKHPNIQEIIQPISKGMLLEEGLTRSCLIHYLHQTKSNVWLRLILTQGINRQIKRMFWKSNHSVSKIIRTHFATLSINGMNPGNYRILSNNEIKTLHNLLI